MNVGFYAMYGDNLRYGLDVDVTILEENTQAKNFDESAGNMLDISARLGYAILPNLDVLGSVGYGYQSFGTVYVGGKSYEDGADGAVYGVGAHYGFSNHVGLMLLAKRYDLSYSTLGNFDYTIDKLSANLTIRF